MNNRIWLIATLLVLFSCVSAFGQEAPKDRTSPHKTSAVSTTPGPGKVSTTDLVDEKTLLIGTGAGGATGDLTPSKSVGVWDFVQMVLVLGLVVAGIYLLFYFLKRAGGRKDQDGGLISVLSSRALQANRSLHLIDVGGKILLIGSSEGSVTLVSSIDDKENVDEIRLKAARGGRTAERKAFRDVFSGAFQKNGGGSSFGSSFMGSMNFLKQQRERLKKM